MGFSTIGYLLEFVLDRERVPSFSEYPFSLNALANFRSLEFHPKVTFFVGENGSGKSTLLEAIAYAVGLNPEGGTRNTVFSTADTHSKLFEYTRLIRSHKYPKDSYFLRAESFYNLASYMDDGRQEYLWTYGGKSLHEQSHGESFFALFMNRLYSNGLYFLDEPEAALSPARQLSFLSRLHQLVEDGAQFLIATHSPILMAYPQATIHLMADGPPRRIAYRQPAAPSMRRCQAMFGLARVKNHCLLSRSILLCSCARLFLMVDAGS